MLTTEENKKTLTVLKYELESLKTTSRVYSKSCNLFFLVKQNQVKCEVDKKIKKMNK